MKLNDVFTRKGLIFIVLFIAVAAIADRINFSALLGTANQTFTLFQFFGPIAGAFLGPAIGAISVLFAELINFVLGAKPFELFTILRLAPMVIAAIYFGRYGIKGLKNFAAFVPLVCMALFMLHPVGQQAWYYSLYWLIPVAAHLFGKRLFFRSLGATFTAHAIGSVIFLYTIPSTPMLWITLIPIVAFERTMFALGITVSYVGFNTVLSKLDNIVPRKLVNVDPRYVISKKMFGVQA